VTLDQVGQYSFKDIITPGYRMGAAHVLDVVSSVASRSFDYVIYEFSALAVTETQCTTTDADDNDDGAAPDPLVLLVATLQCQMQDFESRMHRQEALRSQMVVETWATAAEMWIALRSQMVVEMWATTVEMQTDSTCLLMIFTGFFLVSSQLLPSKCPHVSAQMTQLISPMLQNL